MPGILTTCIAMRRRNAATKTRCALAAAFVLLGSSSLHQTTMAKAPDWGGLDVVERGSPTASRAVVLLHGYGSHPADLVSLHVIVAGFSQGGILSIEMALAGRHPLCGIAVLSGRALGHPAHSYRRLAGLSIFSSHGEGDDRVPFARGKRFVKRARAAGADVHFEVFDGQHEIPAAIVTALAGWLALRACAN